MGDLCQHTHIFAKLRREPSFCLNFLPLSCSGRLLNTIRHNGPEDDEFQAGGFTLEEGKTVQAPSIRKSFLTLKCTLTELKDLSGAGITAMVTSQVQLARLKESYARDPQKRYGPEGFMLLAPAPQDLFTGRPGQSGIGVVEIQKWD